MAKVENINVTLDKLANYTVTTHNDVTGQVANDYFITDVARTLVNVPIYAARNKRSYIDKLHAEMMAYATFDEDGTVLENQSKEYFNAKDKYERLAPRIELEAIAFDHVADQYKAWFKDYTGQDYDEPKTPSTTRKLSKQEQAAMKAIEARRVAAAQWLLTPKQVYKLLTNISTKENAGGGLVPPLLRGSYEGGQGYVMRHCPDFVNLMLAKFSN